MTNNSVSLIEKLETAKSGRDFPTPQDDGIERAIEIIRHHQTSNAEKCKEVAEKDCQAAFEEHMKRAFNGKIQYLKEIMWETWKAAITAMGEVYGAGQSSDLKPDAMGVGERNNSLPVSDKDDNLASPTKLLETLLDRIAELQANGWDYGTHPRDKAMKLIEAVRQWDTEQQHPSMEATQEQLPKEPVSGILSNRQILLAEKANNICSDTLIEKIENMGVMEYDAGFALVRRTDVIEIIRQYETDIAAMGGEQRTENATGAQETRAAHINALNEAWDNVCGDPNIHITIGGNGAREVYDNFLSTMKSSRCEISVIRDVPILLRLSTILSEDTTGAQKLDKIMDLFSPYLKRESGKVDQEAYYKAEKIGMKAIQAGNTFSYWEFVDRYERFKANLIEVQTPEGK